MLQIVPASFRYACLGALVLAALVFIGWGLVTRRHAIPCPAWLAWLLERPFGEDRRARIAIQQLHLESGMRVLDAGCGPGRLTIPIAREVSPNGSVTALDIQEGMLQKARARAHAAGLTNIRFVRAGLERAALEPDYFDRALMVTVLGEIPDREAALRDLFGALKRGGLLSVTEILVDPHYQRRETILRIARKVGFLEGQFFGNRLSFTLNLVKP